VDISKIAAVEHSIANKTLVGIWSCCKDGLENELTKLGSTVRKVKDGTTAASMSKNKNNYYAIFFPFTIVCIKRAVEPRN
jgi:hypothetical protein